MKKRMMLIASCLMAIYNIVSAEDKLTISDFKISAGETKEVSILLNNDDAYVAFQFDLYLPEGITVVSYSANRDRIPESTTLDMSQLEDGAFRFISAAMNAEPMTGDNGGIVVLKVKAEENLSSGKITGYFRKVKLAKADASGPTYFEMSFPITIIEPSVVIVTSQSREYGDNNPEFEYTVSGGELDGKPEISCEATVTSPAGTYDIIISKGSVTNYNVTYVNGVLTITKAPLTVKAGTYSKKQGEENPDFTLTYEGFKNNETETVLTTKPVASCNATKDSAPGEYEVKVSGGEAKNYELSYQNGKLIVTEADAVVITAKSYTRVYGEANPTFEYEVSGAELSGVPEITCDATATSPVGTYPIVIKKGSVTNFNDTYVDGVLTITKAPLTAKAGTYSKKQGEENPDFTLTYEGFKNNETEAVLTTKPVASCNATKDSAPGEYEVKVSGGEAKNYELSYQNGKLIVTEADAVVITAKSYTRVYGEANPTFEYEVSGATLVGVPEITCDATATSPVGTYPIVIKKGSVTNFNDTYIDGVLTITKAPLTAKAGTYSKKQGEENPEFTLTYEGFKNDETETVLTTKPVASCNATKDSAPGEYEVKVSGGEAKNYELSYQNGKLIVTEADAVAITAKSYTRAYGEANPTFEYEVSGAELSGIPEITCDATATSPVGTYPIIIKKGSVTNFNDTYIDGVLTITKAPLTVKAGTYSKKQGEENPEFTLTYEGFKNDETETVLTTKPVASCNATKDSAPGEYEVKVSGGEAKNYELSYQNGKLIVTEADAVVITAKSYTRAYGEANPTFEYEVSGATLVGIPEITCDATATSPVGTYPIVIKKGSVTNFNDTYIDGVLTITKAPLTVKAGTYSKKQGEENPDFTLTYEGFKNDETETVLATKPVASCNATKDSAPGEYEVKVSGGEAQNYEFSYINGKLVVTALQSFTLTYLVDGEVYKTYSVVEGSAITPEEEPTKEGYSFSGWSDIPKTMPDHDVTVTGSFSINMYKLTYMIDEQVYKVVEYEYGATIISEPQPEGDYVRFEWVGVPQTMPAMDVTVYASYETGIWEVLMAQGIKGVYAPNGKKLNKLQKGLNIVILQDSTVKKIVVK